MRNWKVFDRGSQNQLIKDGERPVEQAGNIAKEGQEPVLMYMQ